MVQFRTNRERRLWGWALAVLIAIYSTVGLAGTLASTLAEHDLLGGAFALAFLVVIAAVLGMGLQRRPKANELWIAAAVAAVYGMIVVRMGITPIERTHLFEYGLLAVLIFEALVERGGHEGSLLTAATVAVLLATGFGWIDEGIQWFLPNRVYDLRDVGVNALAGLVATLASLALAWMRLRGTDGQR